MFKRCVLAIAALVFAAGCSPGDSGDGEPSVSEVNDAADRLDDRLETYLTVGGEPPESIEDVDASFFDENEERLAELRSAYREWLSLFEDAVAAGNAPEGQDPADLRVYAELLDEWLSAQEEQASLSRECFDLVGTEGQAAASECYAEMLDEHGREWQETADRLNEFLPG